MKRLQHILLPLTFIIFLSGVSIVFAKKTPPPPPPAVTVVSRWTPQEQLVSDMITNASGTYADTRTVNLQMSARTDRQFWAMDISCTLNIDNVFETSPQMTWAGAWGTSGDTYQDITISYFDDSVNPNRINATITRIGASNSPMGLNGTTYTEFLFDLKLTIKQGLTGTNTVIIACDELSFLDRNGASLGTAVLDNSNNLTIRDGYVISGSASRQGNNNQSDIEVSCKHDDGNLYVTTTETTDILNSKGKVIGTIGGQFSFSNDANNASEPLRDFGLYKCTFTSKIGGTDDAPYLQGTSYINLQTSQYTLQEVTLRTGDTNISGSAPAPDNIIDTDDFLAITANWQDPVTPFEDGDVNGDGFANEVDLAITAGNVGLEDSDIEAEDDVLMDHVLYSVARDYNGAFPNNTLVMGDVFSGDVSTLNSDRVLWPQVSPDGSQIAYYGSSTKYYDKKGRLLPDSNKAVQTVIEEGIIVGNTSSFSGSLIAGGKNFAPSWSPSGNKIAYVCSWDDTGDYNQPSFQFNNGNICVVNASGGSIQTIIPNGSISTYAEVFPPAWYDETTLIYAGNSQSVICADELCYYDFLTNTHGKVEFTYEVDGENTFANMPIMNRQSDGLSYLFYRHFTNSSTAIHMGPIEYSGGVWSGGVLDTTLNTNTQHEEVIASVDVHYYDVSPMMDVMYYGFGEYLFHNLYFVDGSPFTWSDGEDHIVDGFIGYPTINLDNPEQIWNVTEDSPTDFHAFRATFDWIP
jgi:hypothetical protein